MREKIRATPLSAPPRAQQGMALLVALMILLLTAMLGVAAMKSSIFSSKVALSTQVDAMTFEAAESALAVAFDEIGSDAGMTQLLDVLDGGLYQRCVAAGNPLKDGACASTDFLDSAGRVKAEARAGVRGRHPISGSQLSTTAGGAIFVDYELGILGEAEMPAFNLANHHAQEALKRGLMAGFEIE